MPEPVPMRASRLPPAASDHDPALQPETDRAATVGPPWVCGRGSISACGGLRLHDEGSAYRIELADYC